MSRWDYSPIEDASRRTWLESAPPFDEIAKAVAGSMRILCTHCDSCDEAPGYWRIVCCVSVDRFLFDRFFNAQSGYRGCYFISPEEGLRANAHLLQLIAPVLSAFKVHPQMTASRAEQSLSLPSAKAWLAEAGLRFCSLCEGEWTATQDDTAEILNGRWEDGGDPKAKAGRKAPRFEKLRIMGAFVDERGKEYVAMRKRDRAQQIHAFGWS